jgi:hypothetical protein
VLGGNFPAWAAEDVADLAWRFGIDAAALECVVEEAAGQPGTYCD